MPIASTTLRVCFGRLETRPKPSRSSSGPLPSAKRRSAQSIRTHRYCSQYARLLVETGRATEAPTFAEAALAVHTASNGPNHPWTKDSATVTADALDAPGRADEAAVLRARHGLEGDTRPPS
jgi:hypothetical protein